MRMSKTGRPSPAMIVAALALTFALAGTAVAADPVAKLNGKKVKKIAKRQINKAAPNLTVKKAASADAATQAVNSFLANGQTVHKLFTKIPTNTTTPAAVLTASGLSLTATCDAAGDLTFEGTTTVDNSVIGSNFAGGSDFESNFDTGAANAFDPTVGSDTGQGTLTYSTPTGAYVTANFAVDEANTFDTYAGCVVVGSAVSG